MKIEFTRRPYPLLWWFADVEADSGTRLRAIYDRIEAQAG